MSNPLLEQYNQEIKGKKVYFLGAGISHKELLFQYVNKGAKVTLCDRKTEQELGDFAHECRTFGIDLHLGEGYLDGLEEADIVFRTPGLDWTKKEIQNAIAKGVQITSEIETFFDLCPCKIIGITGSDGKTTTTTLIAKVLEEAGYTVHLGGNIGFPLLPRIGQVKAEDIVVVELSSFQLISMRKSPDIAVVTNVTPNHLDHHKDMQEYVDAKRNILLYQKKDSVSILNIENDITRSMAGDVHGELRWFSRENPVKNGAYMDAQHRLISVENGISNVVMDLDGIKLRGLHNKENACTAYAAVRGMVSDEIFARVVSAFGGVEHRIEYVKTVNEVRYYNDSIASSPTRTIAGLRSFEEPMILIAGGYDKHISYEPLAKELLEHPIQELLLCGPTGTIIRDALMAQEGYHGQFPIEMLENVPACVRRAHELAKPGWVVFFSPASASFDAYANFEVRGKHFKELVSEL